MDAEAIGVIVTGCVSIASLVVSLTPRKNRAEATRIEVETDVLRDKSLADGTDALLKQLQAVTEAMGARMQKLEDERSIKWAEYDAEIRAMRAQYSLDADEWMREAADLRLLISDVEFVIQVLWRGTKILLVQITDEFKGTPNWTPPADFDDKIEKEFPERLARRNPR